MLEVEAIDSYYGLAHILHSVSLTLCSGEAVALLGRNGAGKSTVMKSIIGLVRVARGAITFLNQPLAGKPSYRIAQAGIGYAPEERRIFSELTVLENLDIGKRPPRAGIPSWTIEKLFALFPNLADARHRLGGQMSGGEQQMLAIARWLMGNPALILLDEPSQGLSPTIVEQMAQTIKRLKAEGMSLLLSEQNLHFAALVSDRAYVIEKGRIRYSGTMADLAENEAARAAYLTL